MQLRHYEVLHTGHAAQHARKVEQSRREMQHIASDRNLISEIERQSWQQAGNAHLQLPPLRRVTQPAQDFDLAHPGMEIAQAAL